MKKLFFVFALIIVAMAPSVAQDSSAKFVEQEKNESNNYWSMNVGMNLSVLTGDFYSDSHKLGLEMAGYYNTLIVDNGDISLYLKSGLMMSVLGAKDCHYLASENVSQIKTYNITAFPTTLVLGSSVLGDGDSGVSFELGWFLSYIAGGSISTNGETYKPTKVYDFEIDGTIVNTALMSNADIGLCIGSSYYYKRHIASLSYRYGLVNMFSSKINNLGYSGKSSTISLNLGYRF